MEINTLADKQTPPAQVWAAPRQVVSGIQAHIRAIGMFDPRLGPLPLGDLSGCRGCVRRLERTFPKQNEVASWRHLLHVVVAVSAPARDDVERRNLVGH